MSYFQIASSSIAGANSALSFPPVSLTGAIYGPGGPDTFDVSRDQRFSFQAYVTGSAITGTLSLQQSNNCAGWITAQTQSFNSANVAQDVLLSVSANTAQYARLMWSGSAGASASMTFAKFGAKAFG